MGKPHFRKPWSINWDGRKEAADLVAYMTIVYLGMSRRKRRLFELVWELTYHEDLQGNELREEVSRRLGISRKKLRKELWTLKEAFGDLLARYMEDFDLYLTQDETKNE